jgi:hypothetical protein
VRQHIDVLSAGQAFKLGRICETMTNSRVFQAVAPSGKIIGMSQYLRRKAGQTMSGVGLCTVFSQQGDWAFDYALALAITYQTKVKIHVQSTWLCCRPHRGPCRGKAVCSYDHTAGLAISCEAGIQTFWTPDQSSGCRYNSPGAYNSSRKSIGGANEL